MQWIQAFKHLQLFNKYQNAYFMKKFYTLFSLGALLLPTAPMHGAVPFQTGKNVPKTHKSSHVNMRAPQTQTVVNEDFSQFADGSETEPGAEITYVNSYYIPDEMTSQPGWTGQAIYPAGGAIVLKEYINDSGNQKYGYISTPRMDLGGTASLKFRAKRFNGGKGTLWVSLCDDYYGPGEDQEDFILTDEWETYTMVAKAGSLEDPAYFQIQAENGYVMIDDIRIDFIRDRIASPYAQPAENISSTEFVARWESTGAPTYRLNVYYLQKTTDENEGCLEQGFDEININSDGKTINSSQPGYPAGWSIDVNTNGDTDVTTETANLNSAPLALVFDAVGDMITSEELPEPLSELSFWVKPSANEDDETVMSLIRVELFHSSTETWESIAQIPYYWMEEDGDFYTLVDDALGDDVTRVRLSMIQKGLVNFYIDDIKMGYRARGTRVPVIKDKILTETEYHVTGINPAEEYYYYVEAIDDEVVSEKSAVIWVDGIKGLKVSAEEPTNVSATGFTANWQPLGHATSYKVESFRITHATADMNNVVVLEESFDAINEGTVDNPGTDWISPFDFGAKGWASTSWCATQPAWAAGMAGTTGTAIWSGQAGLVYSPLLDLRCNGGEGFDVEATVVTTVESFVDNDGNTNPEGVFVMVLNGPNDTQALAHGFISTPKIGSTTEKVHVPVSADVDLSNVIVAFMNMSGTPFFVDYVKITQNLKAGETMQVPMSINLADGNSMDFRNLTAGSDHAYRVTASTNRNFVDYVSEPSDMINVATSQASVGNTWADTDFDVTVVATDGVLNVNTQKNTPIELFSIAGNRIAVANGSAEFAVPAGVYIVNAGGKIFKVAVK